MTIKISEATAGNITVRAVLVEEFLRIHFTPGVELSDKEWKDFLPGSFGRPELRVRMNNASVYEIKEVYLDFDQTRSRLEEVLPRIAMYLHNIENGNL